MTGSPVHLGRLERHGFGVAKGKMQLDHRALRSGHQGLRDRVDLRVLMGEPQRRSREVNEASLVREQFGASPLAPVAR